MIETLSNEIDQLKKDNLYLVDILKKSKKHQGLANFIKDSGGMSSKLERLSPPIRSQSDMYNRRTAPSETQRLTEEMFPTKENGDIEDDMVPTEAFQIAN